MIEIEALQLALSRERQSIKTYEKLLVEHPRLKELFSFLITEEQKHAAMIEKKIVELTRL
jgi:rubrerythrin